MDDRMDGAGQRGPAGAVDTAPRVEVYRRTDGRWGWRLSGGTGVVLAQDGGLGFDKLAQAENVAERVTGGDYRECPIVAVTELSSALTSDVRS
jgi:hypothetical protein